MNILANQSRAIFLEAIELQSPVQRAELVAKACAEEPKLRAQVERLLRSRELLGSFQGDVPAPTVAFDQLCLEKVGTRRAVVFRRHSPSFNRSRLYAFNANANK